MPYETKDVSFGLRAGKRCSACCHAGGGAIGLRGNGRGGRPTAQRKYIPPVLIEIADGTIGLSFMRDLGEVTIELQQTPDITVFSQTINASTQHETTFTVTAGTYILTATTADESMLVKECIVIP